MKKDMKEPKENVRAFASANTHTHTITLKRRMININGRLRAFLFLNCELIYGLRHEMLCVVKFDFICVSAVGAVCVCVCESAAMHKI